MHLQGRHQLTFTKRTPLAKRAGAPLISVLIPVHNEEKSIKAFLGEIKTVQNEILPANTELIFINDGSTDATLETLLFEQQKQDNIIIISLTRNFGKEAALSAGLDHAHGDAVIPIDVDLQDPPNLIKDMIIKWQEGYDVVNAYRAHRGNDSFSKRLTSHLFYKIHNSLSDPKIPENVGDFRLLDRCVVEALKTISESRRFMKGLFSWVGFRSTCVTYSRPHRKYGKTKFNFWKLLDLAIEGLTSFSTAPLRLWSYTGILISLLSLVYATFIVSYALLKGIDVPGYASLMTAITFLGGLQLMGIGLLGEYLSRTYLESKRRPTYLIQDIYR